MRRTPGCREVAQKPLSRSRIVKEPVPESGDEPRRAGQGILSPASKEQACRPWQQYRAGREESVRYSRARSGAPRCCVCRVNPGYQNMKAPSSEPWNGKDTSRGCRRPRTARVATRNEANV